MKIMMNQKLCQSFWIKQSANCPEIGSSFANESLLKRSPLDYNFERLDCSKSILAFSLLYEVTLASKTLNKIDVSDETVLRAQAGDAFAFNELVRKFHRGVVSRCSSICGWSRCQDVAQEVWLEMSNWIVATEQPTLDLFRNWLFTLAELRSLNDLKRQKREPTQLPVDNEGRTIEVIDRKLLTSNDMEENELLTADVEKVIKCLAEHKEDTWIEYLRMRYFDGYSVNEIAVLSGMVDNKDGGVTQKLNRAFKRLARCVRGVQS